MKFIMLLIAGAGALVMTTIIVMVLISTMADSNLLRSTATTTTETYAGWLNDTGYNLTNFSKANRGHAVVVVNASTTVGTDNYTFNTATGQLKNKTIFVHPHVNITYTYIQPTDEENTLENMTGNFSSGVRNVSNKIPTVLLVGAVVILFGVIVFLWQYYDKMGFGRANGSL